MPQYWNKTGDLNTNGQAVYQSAIDYGCIANITISQITETNIRVIVAASSRIDNYVLDTELCELAINAQISKNRDEKTFTYQSDNKDFIALFLKTVMDKDVFCEQIKADIERSLDIHLTQRPFYPPGVVSALAQLDHLLSSSDDSPPDSPEVSGYEHQYSDIDEVSSITTELDSDDSQPPETVPSLGINFEKLENASYTGAIPENYLCPLSMCIMTDPVYPISNPQHKFERSWIERHVSLNPTNPLNRAPLSLTDLIADTALQAEIKQFVDKTIAPKRKRKSADELAKEEAEMFTRTKQPRKH